MFYLDNSETSWLVYADWLEDQDIDATHIREMNPVTNQWIYEVRLGGGGGFGGVGVYGLGVGVYGLGVGGCGGCGIGGFVGVGARDEGFVGVGGFN